MEIFFLDFSESKFLFGDDRKQKGLVRKDRIDKDVQWLVGGENLGSHIDELERNALNGTQGAHGE